MTSGKKKLKLHKWNVVCVKKFKFPMPNPIEFSVESKNHLGASMKASKKLKEMEEGWIIKSLYWLDPFCYKNKEN